MRLQLFVVADLVECLFSERERRGGVVAVVADTSEEQQRLGAQWSGGSRCDSLFQIARGLVEVSGLERELARMDRSMDPLFDVVGRGQLASEIDQARRGVGRASSARLSGRGRERSGDIFVRPIRSEGEVPRLFLLVDRDRREPAVRVSAFGSGRHRILHGREERMRRSDPPPARLDHTLVEGGLDVSVRIRPPDRLCDHGCGRLRRGRREQEHVPDRIGEPGEPVGDQIDQRRRHRQRTCGLPVDPLAKRSLAPAPRRGRDSPRPFHGSRGGPNEAGASRAPRSAGRGSPPA